MIRFTDKSLIIEILCGDTVAPLEQLADLQTGLLHCITIIDHKDAPPQYITWALHQLHILLSEMNISREQMGKIHEQALKNASFNKAFQVS